MNTVLKAIPFAIAIAAAGMADSHAAPSSLNALDEAVIEITTREADQAPQVIEQPARVVWELGAVIGLPNGETAPRVMAVTPGAAAERMGLRTGDRLLAVNDQPLPAGSPGADRLRAALDSGEGHIAFDVQRDNETVPVEGALDRREVPGYRLEIAANTATRGCGRVHVGLKPPVSQELFPIVLHEVDGGMPGPLSNQVFRLSPGRHVLKVSEDIDGTRFTGLQNDHRVRLQRSEMFKYMTLDVEPNTTYRLGVKFFKDKREPIREQRYWEPVVWKQFEENCR